VSQRSKFECVGFVFLNNRHHFTDPEDYLCYQNRVWSAEDAERELSDGMMPPGMLVKAIDGNKIGVVVGNYNDPQEIVLIEDL
jgi:hypothetical protein